MFDYVIDTNIIMSILISGKTQYRAILSYFKFYLPEFSLLELNEYKHLIFEKTKFSQSELKNFVYLIFSSVSLIPTFALSDKSIREANNICKNIDVKDIPFLALSIDMNLTLLTRDLYLLNGLKRQKYRNVMLFKDFLSKL